MHLIKHLAHPRKYIPKHKSWDQITKTAKLPEQNHTKIVIFCRYTNQLYQSNVFSF